MSNLLIVPDFSGRTFSGQLQLNVLSHLADILTETAKELRAEGYKRMTFEQVLKRLEKNNPETFANVVPDMFLFTGRRVIPNAKTFFEWYSTTAEGRAYKNRVERYAPNMYGSFAKITR